MYIAFYKNRNRSLWKSKELNRILKRIRKSRPFNIQAFASISVNICTLCRKVWVWSCIIICSCLAAGAEGALTTKKPSCGSANEAAAVTVYCLRNNISSHNTTPLPTSDTFSYSTNTSIHTLVVFFCKRSNPYRSECKI